MYCFVCNRLFNNQQCFQNHLETKIKTKDWDKSVCLSVFGCQSCGKVVDMSERSGNIHVCNETYCKLCFKFVPSNHLCYIKKHIKKTPKNLYFSTWSVLKTL